MSAERQGRMMAGRPAGFRLAAVAALVSALAACGTAEPVPADRYYRLDVAVSQRFQQPELNGVVEVERFAADGVTAGRPIVYTERADSLELKAYHYHFWAEPPTVMLRDALVRALRAAGAAREVVAPESRIRPDYVVTGEIKRMEHVAGSTPQQAVLEIGLVLRGAQSGNLMLLRTYRIEREFAGGSMNEFVTAMNAAASEALQRFLADLAEL